MPSPPLKQELQKSLSALWWLPPKFQTVGNSQLQEAVQCYIWMLYLYIWNIYKCYIYIYGIYIYAIFIYMELPKPGDQTEVIIRYQGICKSLSAWVVPVQQTAMAHVSGAIDLRCVSVSEQTEWYAGCNVSSLRQWEQSNPEPSSNEP